MFGKRPFRGRTNTALTNSILHEPLQWPDDAGEKCSAEGMQAIKGLLERDPNRRLGYRPGGGGLDDLKAHPWFRGIDWEKLRKKEVVPPFEPDVSRSVQPLYLYRVGLRNYGHQLHDKGGRADMYSLNEQTLTRRTSWRNCYWRRTL